MFGRNWHFFQQTSDARVGTASDAPTSDQSALLESLFSNLGFLSVHFLGSKELWLEELDPCQMEDLD